MIFGREPSLVLGLLQAGLALAIGFGLQLSGEQVALIMAFAATIASVWVRSKVTPNATGG